MRYQSFYPFSQSQTPHTPQQFSSPQNPFPNGPSRNPFGLGNPGSPPSRQQGPGPGAGRPLNALNRIFGQGNSDMQQGQRPGQDNPGNSTGPNKIEQYLQTADRFLNTAQQITPMVNKVAPMVQNLPALWKIYRGFQNMPDATAPNSVASNNVPTVTPPRASGVSQPRIFQPPI